MVILDATIVNVALPSIGKDLGGGVSSLQWVLDAYTIVFAGLLLPAGSLGDRLGARRVFDGGLLLFTAASLACGVAPSVAVLVAARVVQGVGAALLVPSSLALLRGTYDSPSERARAVGVWGAVAGIAAASGPVLGGLLSGLVSWRAVFFVNLPVGIVGLALSARWLSRTGETLEGGIDPAGQLLGILALTLLTFGMIEAGDAGWGSVEALVPLAAFVPVAVAFVLVEHRTREPMLPLGLFRSRTFSAASFVGLAINLGFYGQLFAISLYFQHVRGFGAVQTGLAILPEGIFVALSSALSGRAVSRVGPRVPMLFGLVLGAAGFVGLIAAGAHTSYWVLVVPLVAAGFGMSFTMPAATAAVIEASPAERAGIASGVLNAARQAGGAIGVALLGSLIAGQAFVAGLHAAMGVAAGSFLAGALVTAVWVQRQERARERERERGTAACARTVPARR
jgi:DHA2 family methylenomycin A resistance protein-like MFS transporter